MKLRSVQGQVDLPLTGRVAPEQSRRDAVVQNNTDAGDGVSISGHGLLISRLFQGVEPIDNAPLGGGGVQHLEQYLTPSDRSMLEKMYEYSASSGIDLRHVDAVASDLGMYRAFGSNTAPSQIYDSTGREIKVRFSAGDQEYLQSIEGKIGSSTIDQGFLRSELTVSGHATNFEFLERMVSVFSTDPADVGSSSLPQYDAQRSTLSTEVETEPSIKMPVADIKLDKDAKVWREKDGGASSGENPAIVEFLNTRGIGGGFMEVLLGVANKNRIDSSAFLELLRATPRGRET